jgi:hypothetical protein
LLALIVVQLSPRLMVVLASVLALHVGLLVWVLQPSSVSGQGAWQARPSTGFRVRATVLQEVALASSSDKLAFQPVVQPEASTVAESPPNPTLAPSIEKSGELRNWTPMPSEYLAVEQVDTYPRPKDEWQLDWKQVQSNLEAWHITVRMWVSAAGQIDHVELMDAQPSGDWGIRLVEPLVHTDMVPGSLAGQPVPVTYVVQLAPDQLQ